MAAPAREPAAAEILSNERLRQALAVRDWLLGEAREIRDPNVILEGLCLKLATPACGRSGRQRDRVAPCRARRQCPRLGARRPRA